MSAATLFAASRKRVHTVPMFPPFCYTFMMFLSLPTMTTSSSWNFYARPTLPAPRVQDGDPSDEVVTVSSICSGQEADILARYLQSLGYLD